MNDGKDAEFTPLDQTFILFHYLNLLTKYSVRECVCMQMSWEGGCCVGELHGGLQPLWELLKVFSEIKIILSTAVRHRIEKNSTWHVIPTPTPCHYSNLLFTIYIIYSNWHCLLSILDPPVGIFSINNEDRVMNSFALGIKEIVLQHRRGNQLLNFYKLYVTMICTYTQCS